MRALPFVAFVAVAIISSPALRAEEARQEYLGLDVNGNIEIAPDKSLKQHGAVLIVHGTLAHHRMEIVTALQAGLKQRGINSLAITLSLGLNARKGMFDCGLEHDHRHADAADEIVAWVEWLQNQGAARVSVLGHSRGAAQAALALVERPDLGVHRLILAGPLMTSRPELAERYARDLGQPLSPLLEKSRELVEAGEGDTLIEVPGFFHCRPAKVTAAAFYDYYSPDPQHDALSLLQSIRTPSLVAVAGDDRIAPGVGAAAAGLLNSGNLPATVSVATIDGADHFFRDLYGDDLADKVAEFVVEP